MLRLNSLLFAAVLVLGFTNAPAIAAPVESVGRMNNKIVFATYAGDSEELAHCLIFAASVREFAGALSEVPIRIYHPRDSLATLSPGAMVVEAESLASRIDRRRVCPQRRRSMPYAGKTFAASQAEGEAANGSELLAWFDEDTIVLTEPSELLLPDSMAFAFRPVMHLLIGSPYSEPPDEFWRRVYQVTEITESTLFAMKTVVDEQTIRPYFNAGLSGGQA